MVDAIENAISVWAHGVNSLLEDEENHPRLRNISLLPELACDGDGPMHWKNGRILYE